MLLFFGLWDKSGIGINVNYKIVESLYYDELVRMALHNMFVLTVERKCDRKIGISGNGTGYTPRSSSVFYKCLACAQSQ